MGRGRALTEVERTEILTHHRRGCSNRWIAREMGRNRRVVNSFLKDPTAYGTKKSPGRPKKLAVRQTRRIVNAPSNATASCSTIETDQDLNVPIEAVRRTTRECGFIKRSKMLKAPELSDIHKIQRLAFARANVRTDFTNFIWSDGKKRNLDGYNSYWKDLRKEPHEETLVVAH